MVVHQCVLLPAVLVSFLLLDQMRRPATARRSASTETPTPTPILIRASLDLASSTSV